MSAAVTPESIESLQLQSGLRLAGCYVLIKPIHGAPERAIWLANDEVLAKDVALHFLPQELVGQAGVAERLKQEVKRSRPLIHPHILRTYDFIEEEGWWAISTDAFEGPTLAGLLQDGAREVAEIQPWIGQICSTLQEAHRIRIVHAGLTPHDAAIDARREVRLMNFGISAVIRDALRAPDSRGQNRTLSYASPDQLGGAKATVADDIFAVGALVHELLSGEPPYSGADRSTPPQSISAHRDALGHRGDPVPESWEDAVTAALTGASSRPATIGQWWELISTPVVSTKSAPVDQPPAAISVPDAAGTQMATEEEAPSAAQAEEPIVAESLAEELGTAVQVESAPEPIAHSVPEEPSLPSDQEAIVQTEPETVVHSVPEGLVPEAVIQPAGEAPIEAPEPPADAVPETPVPAEPDAPVHAALEDMVLEVTPQSTPVEEQKSPEPVDATVAKESPEPVESSADLAPEPARTVDHGPAAVVQQGFVSQPPPSALAPTDVVKPSEQRQEREKKPHFAVGRPESRPESRQGSGSKPKDKRRISLGATPAKSTPQPKNAPQPITPVDADRLAEEVRREEAEQEARQLGYFNSDKEDVYLPRRRSFSGTRLALPIIGAALALAALFGVFRMLVGTPDNNHSNTAGTSTTTATEPGVPSSSPTAGTPELSSTKTGTPLPAETHTGPLPGDSRPPVDISTEPPATTLANEPPPKVTPPAPVEPTKSAAEEYEVALQKVRESEAKLAETKKELGEKTKSLPQMLKSAGDLAAQQKKKDEEAKKTEQAATQAEQVATEKRRVADEAKKAATALAEETKSRQEEHAKTKELLVTLQTNLREEEKALADANTAAASAAAAVKQQQEEAKKPVRTESPSVAVAPPSNGKEEVDPDKTRNSERKRIDDEMAALRRKLAEQAQKLGAKLDEARSPEAAPVSQPKKEPEPAPQPLKVAPSAERTVSPDPGAELTLNQSDVPSLPDVTPSADQSKNANARDTSGEYMNSLGMKFTRVPSAEPIFCIWPTRVRDFETFARSTGLKSTLWKDPGFKQGPEHPVVNVTYQEAIAFCKWLTSKEQKEGLIAADQSYRLPTDLEWSRAVGLSNEPGRTPEERDMGIPEVYPWGKSWPPPAGAGNYTGEETGSDVAIKGYDDAFPWTSPVGSFPANSFGLFDMGGNVWEWCMDTWNSQSKARVLRGASWYNGALKLSLLSSCRVHASPDSGTDNYGFRVVIAGGSGSGKNKK